MSDLGVRIVARSATPLMKASTTSCQVGRLRSTMDTTGATVWSWEKLTEVLELSRHGRSTRLRETPRLFSPLTRRGLESRPALLPGWGQRDTALPWDKTRFHRRISWWILGPGTLQALFLSLDPMSRPATSPGWAAMGKEVNVKGADA